MEDSFYAVAAGYATESRAIEAYEEWCLRHSFAEAVGVAYAIKPTETLDLVNRILLDCLDESPIKEDRKDYLRSSLRLMVLAVMSGHPPDVKFDSIAINLPGVEAAFGEMKSFVSNVLRRGWGRIGHSEALGHIGRAAQRGVTFLGLTATKVSDKHRDALVAPTENDLLNLWLRSNSR